MTTIKGTARQTISLEWDGTEQDLILLCNELSLEYFGEEMDSLDLGDAMGTCIRILHSIDTDTQIFAGYGATLTITETTDLFDWNR